MFFDTPQWVYPNARFDFDFANNRYWGGYVTRMAAGNTAEQMKSVTQGGTPVGTGVTSYAPDIYGNLLRFDPGVIRITHGYGSWAEGNYTNRALHSRDLTNAAWTATNVTTNKDQPGADYPSTNNGGTLLTATSANGTVIQATVLSSTTFVFSAWVKRITGTGTINMTVDNGATWVDVTSQISSARYQQVQIPVQTLANPTFGFRIVTSGDAIAVDFAQCENSPLFATTPIVTTTAAVARGVDIPAISDPGTTRPGDGQRLIKSIIVTGGPWSVLIIGSGNGNPTNNNMILSDGGVTIGGLAGTNGAAAAATFQANGLTAATTANTGNVGLHNINKIAGRASGSGNAVCLNGGAIATQAGAALTPIGTAFTHMGLGNRGAGDRPLNGYISRLVFWNQEISNGQMVEWTR